MGSPSLIRLGIGVLHECKEFQP